jgi:hypothetical protein
MKPQGLNPILLLNACLVLSPMAQAVLPPPDGGYPGGNTAEGQNALFSLTSGGYNTAVGYLSLRSDATASFNTAIGAGTLLANIGDNNTATGAGALLSNIIGASNTATGTFALFSNATGGGNTANGFHALLSNATGGGNTAIGYGALESNTADRNTAIGVAALATNSLGSENIALGYLAGVNVVEAHNVICIGSTGEDQSNGCYIDQIFNATSSGGTAVFINSNGKLGTTTSSRRFKEEIKPMEQASEALLALSPVTFRYKREIDPQGVSQFGLVAEDVEKVNPQLVVRDKEGKPYSVRYDQVNAMLLNEFLKEHRTVQQLKSTVAKQDANAAKQEATIARQQKQIDALTVGLQKVSAQLAAASQSGGGLETSKPALQLVSNNP